MRKLRGYRWRERRERKRKGHKGDRGGNLHATHRERVAQEKRQRTERSETEIELEAAGETSYSSSQLHRKKGKMTNIFLTDSDEEVIVYLVKD